MIKRRVRGRPGVSEVVGALMLIIVVISAISALAYFLASAQQSAGARQTYLTQEKDDLLEITDSNFTWTGGHLSQLILALRNTNTQPSSVKNVALNGEPLLKWYGLNATEKFAGDYLGYNATGYDRQLFFVARGSAFLMINSTSFGTKIFQNSTLQLTLESQYGNFFNWVWLTPSAQATGSLSTRQWQSISQDVLTLDGSKSTATNGTLVNYSWALNVPSTCPGFSSANATVTGESFIYAPQALFPSTYAAPYRCDTITGPISVTLTVTDSNGFVATSQPFLAPNDPAIAPAASITVSSGPLGGSVTLLVTDAYGRPIGGQVVTASVISGSLSFTSNVGTTNPSSGLVTFMYTGTGAADFQTGSLVPLEVTF